MCHRLYVAGIVPAEVLVLFNKCCHGRDPRLVLEALESTFQGLFNFWKSLVVALQSVAATAHRSGDQAKLGACDAPAGGRVVTWSGHLGGICQASGYCFSFFNFHNFLYLLIVAIAWRLQLGA